ncbi:hypothetical protein BDQ12DRAFT_693389 [Crucibulum laeve]|uniref:FAD-binding PCMH-type domain-containing protein n=1 Tax=Crucibulum laeve TaxID=68775 RepID=A0A5C3LJ34_9AGAR|nr:hypothetical protein BDQ12DRAFT_693389 [Crucibulum laeve]
MIRILSLPLFLVASVVTPGLHTNNCRCLYGQSCWPNNSAFSSLETQLSQSIIRPIPVASPCYPASSPGGNCTDVQVHLHEGNWRADQSGALQNLNFETYTYKNGTISGCYVNASLGFLCEQGSIPPIGVDARSVSDVQAAVKFAAKNNLRLVVKNTGHDYLGRSTARGGFMLWTHHMKDIVYSPAFIPEGAQSSEAFNAITLGAGVQWHEAYNAVQSHGRFIVGGFSAGGSVGAAGGWVMGAGHSAFAPRHGLGVDNVIQFEIVTAKSEHLIVNSNQNSDLFWALRGGGGGTYGVVISTTYRTHEEFPLTSVIMVANFSSTTVAKSVVTEYLKIHPALADAGWGGYSSLSNATLQMLYVAPNRSVADTNLTMNTFFDFVSNVTGAPTQAFLLPYDSFFSWYTQFFSLGVGQVGYNVELGSRLLPRQMVETNAEKVADIMLSLEGGVALNFVAGGAVSKVDPESTGLNPSWRKAIAHVYFTEVWNDGDSSIVIEQARQRLRDKLNILDGIAPDSGTYLNEASLYEKDFQKTFFGAHYKKLKAIKNKYDPKGLFIVASGVGSDDWDSSLNCRLL